MKAGAERSLPPDFYKWKAWKQEQLREELRKKHANQHLAHLPVIQSDCNGDQSHRDL